MNDSLVLGSSPTDEECVQVGSNNYYEQAKKECSAYIKQLIRHVL